MSKVDLTQYICKNPFQYTEIHHDRQTFCCPEWLEEYVESKVDYGLNWNSKKANDIRKSVTDGTFKFCSTSKCPHLSTLVNSGDVPPTSPIKRKEDFTLDDFNSGPIDIKFIFDSACNLACPSCRVDFIRNNKTIYSNSKLEIKKISKAYGNSIERITMSGTGDPFYSTAFFEFLENIDENEYPNLSHIHLHTNGILWNEKNWDKIKNAHRYIKSAEISIDASTKETYEVVRRGGNWELLQRNLKFIKDIDTLNSLSFSFVVQKQNYFEVIDFYHMIKSIFFNYFDHPEKNILVSYYKILDWGHLPKDVYKEIAVWEGTNKKAEKIKEYGKILTQLDPTHIVHNLF